MDYRNILIHPIITEKATGLKEQDKYFFKVDMRANKVEVSRAVEKMYNVEVKSCNIINVRGKKKRVRYKEGFSSGYKKAIVTLKKGDKLPFFENA